MSGVQVTVNQVIVRAALSIVGRQSARTIEATESSCTTAPRPTRTTWPGWRGTSAGGGLHDGIHQRRPPGLGRRGLG